MVSSFLERIEHSQGVAWLMHLLMVNGDMPDEGDASRDFVEAAIVNCVGRCPVGSQLWKCRGSESEQPVWKRSARQTLERKMPLDQLPALLY